LFTFTRGGALSYLAGLSLFAFITRKKTSLFRNVIYFVVVVNIVCVLWDYIGEYALRRLTGHGSLYHEESFLHRQSGYAIFIKFIGLNPFLGIGLGSSNYYRAYNLVASSIFSGAETLDNAYLSFISGMGLVSLVPIILFARKLKTILQQSLKDVSDNYYTVKAGLVCAICAVLLSFLFYDGLYYLAMTSMSFILIGIIFSYYIDGLQA
jgi:hypothetical protein